MESLRKSLVRKLAVSLGFPAMAAANWLAMAGKINSVTTAAVSDEYKTLFTPANYTFSIWGLIYLLLLVYVLFQLFSRNLGKDGKPSKIAFWFVASCILNIGWLFAWHYRQLIVSVAVMLALLACLMRILRLLSDTPKTAGSLIGLELPFGLYAGWITVATVVNVSALLVSLGLSNFLIPDFVWLILLAPVTTLIAVAASGSTRNVAYPAAILWGFAGVMVRFLPDFRFDLQSDAMWIVLVFGLCMLAVAIRWIDLVVRRAK
jgi:hypothetical protein